ncbi:MAG TPA: hypothetical protein VHM24_00925 [Gemmatimonadaceae bacterium]|nr:hypothetical protein [Gemmatimonadaceae bacterium]
MAERHNSIREGVFAGIIGATAIVIWFGIIDILAGQPFHTPNILGAGLISVLGKPPMMPDTVAIHVIIYTLFHYLAFFLVGIVVATIVHQASRTPAILAGFLIAFVAFELGAIGLTALLTESALGGMAWYQIFIANLLAAAGMFWFMWKRHPGLGHDIEEALTGTDDHHVPASHGDRSRVTPGR